MKKINKYLMLLLATAFFFACEERNPGLPEIKEPVYNGPKATMTIAEFKEMATKRLAQIASENSNLNSSYIADSIRNKNIVLKGIVTANDISGNFYKQLQIQDETGGICIAIDATSLYHNYGLGQTLYVNCDGLDVGYYGDYLQLGQIYYNETQKTYQIGQMSYNMSTSHLSVQGFPAPELVKSDTITLDSLGPKYVGRLVTLKDVYFKDADGKMTFSDPSPYGATTTRDRALKSSEGGIVSVTARNSTASNFARSILPEGIGMVTGILSVYTSTYQLTFRDSLDCSLRKFNTTPNGTKAIPWGIDYAIKHQNETSDQCWVRGYIVGTLKEGVTTVTGSDDFAFQAPFSNNTILLAASANEKNWKNCIVVNLPTGSEIQEMANLSLYPKIFGRQMKVKGLLSNYLGAAGVKIETGAASEYYIYGGGGIFRETFEGDAPNKTSYSLAKFEGTATVWEASAVIMSGDNNDRKIGTRSARLRDPNATNATPHYIMMTEDKPDGAGTISLYRGMYGSNKNGEWKLEVSDDGGINWKTIAEESNVPSDGKFEKISFENVNIKGNIRIKITKTNLQTANGTSGSSINIDNIEITDYTP